jgi:hypothetical protein
MEIKGLGNITPQQLSQDIIQGGRFVYFEYCVSLLVITLRNSTDIHYVRPGEGTFGRSAVYSLISLVIGWWGFPWGPIYTIGSLYTNFSGGKDVTYEVMNHLDGQTAFDTSTLDIEGK